MGFLSKEKNESVDMTSIDCGDVLTIAKVTELQAQLKESLGRGTEIKLHAENIERIDASVLQLYTAFFNAAATRKIKASWIEPSEVLLRSARLLGLSAKLELPTNW